jgi:hypothetical protein
MNLRNLLSRIANKITIPKENQQQQASKMSQFAEGFKIPDDDRKKNKETMQQRY